MEAKNEEGLTEKEYLERYRPGDYERPSVTVDMMIFAVDPGRDDDTPQLLLIKRKNHPCIGKWAVPGGFVAIDESLEEAAARELFEETGIEGIVMEQLYTWGSVKRDPRMRVISVSYLAIVPKNALIPAAGDDAAEAVWFSVGKKKLSDLEDGATYALTIENEERRLFLSYRIMERYEQRGMMAKRETKAELFPAIDTKKEEELAFDHVYLISMAMDRMAELEKEWKEQAV